MRRLGAAICAAALTLAGPVAAAHADVPAQATALCVGAPHGCALQARGWLREGATTEVTVIGNPHVRVQIVIYSAVVEKGQLVALEPVSTGAEVFTSSDGVAHASVTVPARPDSPSSGWALLSVGGVSSTDVSTTVGQFMPYGARIPTLLGDGFAAEGKPVGEVLEMQLVGAVPGTGFAIDYADEAGIWQEVTAEGGTIAASPDGISTVYYAFPRGLLPNPYKFRIRNISDSAPAPLWLGTPDHDGIPQERDPVFVPPPVGDALEGTALRDMHPERLVIWSAWGLGGVCLAWAVGACLLNAARRPRWGAS